MQLQSNPKVIPFERSNHFVNGDCIQVMQGTESETIDFVLTDPPYLAGYVARDGRRLQNDTDSYWLKPAFAQMYRVLKPNSFCVSFYGFTRINLFIDAFLKAGFRIEGHIVFTKRYTSSSKYLKRQHESAYLLAKGMPQIPEWVIGDVHDFVYTRNKHHPTEKPISMLQPLIETFCSPKGIVLDPFAGSGSTLLAARNTGRHYYGIELDRVYYDIARKRLDTHF